MPADLTSAEYRALLDLLFVGDAVLHSYAGEREETETHRRALDKLLGEAGAQGCGPWVERLPDGGGLGFSERMNQESRANEWLEDYEDRTFWEQLIQRLADRDLQRRRGPEGESEEAVQRRRRRAERGYAREFDINGLRHLELARPLHGPQ